MTRKEFMNLHANGVAALDAYVIEAQKTAEILAACTLKPMSFEERFRLMAQMIIERDAHLTYIGIRRLLLSAARFGYSSN